MCSYVTYNGVIKMNENEIFEIADLFKMFADATRVKILLSLFEKVSHQLRALKHSHLVKCRREGKNIYYSLADDHVKIIINCAIEHVEE